jgi:CubicO group peptidase (beta-lactamase class C family)
MAQDREPHTVSEVLASFAHTPLHFSPGERFEYSNSNYFLLGLAIEKTSGLRYEDYLQKFVLGPAGLRRTSTIDAPDAANSAIGYIASEADDGLVPDGPFDMSLPFSAGALRSTANDLLAWDRAWTNHTLLTAASQTRMVTVEAKLQREDGRGYGYGLGVSQRAGRQVIVHGGAIRGFTSYLGRIPEEGLVVIALCNAVTFNASLVADPIMDMFLHETPLAPPVEKPASVMGKELAGSLAGKYVLRDESRAEMSSQLSAAALEAFAVMELEPATNKLFLVSAGERVEVFRGPGGEIFCKRDHVKLTFEPDTAAPMQVLLQQGPFRLRYDRTKSRDSTRP